MGRLRHRRLLADAGFVDVEIEVTRVHAPSDFSGTSCCGVDMPCGTESAAPAQGDADAGRIVSAFVRARRPVPRV